MWSISTSLSGVCPDCCVVSVLAPLQPYGKSHTSFLSYHSSYRNTAFTLLLSTHLACPTYTYSSPGFDQPKHTEWGRGAITRTASRWHVTSEARLWSQANLCGVFFLDILALRVFRSFPSRTIPPILLARLSIKTLKKKKKPSLYIHF